MGIRALFPWRWGAEPSSGTSRLRIRAVDPFSKVSAWVTSGTFTVEENSPATIELQEPVDFATGTEPYIVFLVDDVDGDDIHVHLLLSMRPDFVGAHEANSLYDQTGWEESSDGNTWTDLPSGGATAGNYVRYQSPALRYDYYYLRARAYDGTMWSEYLPTTMFLVTVDGTVPLTCTIGDTSYYIANTVILENTGGEPSPIEFDVSLAAHRESPVVRGMAVSVGLSLEGLSRTWNATVESVEDAGGWVHVYCLQDDAYMSRKLVTGDLVSDDIGANLATLVDTYGSPLDNTEMDTSLGVSAAITGDYKTLGSHLKAWQGVLGYLFWVDSTGTVHLIMPEDMADPEYILWEDYQ